MGLARGTLGCSIGERLAPARTVPDSVAARRALECVREDLHVNTVRVFALKGVQGFQRGREGAGEGL